MLSGKAAFRSIFVYWGILTILNIFSSSVLLFFFVVSITLKHRKKKIEIKLNYFEVSYKFVMSIISL